VIYGSEVPFEATFIQLLGRGFQTDGLRVEVINAGVEGYTSYNELHYYLERGRRFDPDLVVVGFVLNDVVNPLLHWTQTGNETLDVPDAAIPNLEYHAEIAVPKYLSQQRRRSWKRRSALFRLLDAKVLRRLENRFPESEQRQVQMSGRYWPTYLTLEDDLSIQVLTNYDSREWRWLRRLFSELQDAVRADGAEFAVIVFPLAYQLEEGYPFLPQDYWRRFCQERSIACLDLLPHLRNHDVGEVFQLRKSGYFDVWHLSEDGHRIVSEKVRSFIEGSFLIDTATVNARRSVRAGGRARLQSRDPVGS
jgi:hypothetical protein